MHDFDANIWELIYYRKCAVGLGYVGSWYQTRYRYRIFDYLLTTIIIIMVVSNLLMSFGSTLHFLTVTPETIADLSLNINLMCTIWFGNFQLICMFLQRKSYSEVIAGLQSYIKKCTHIFGREKFRRDFKTCNHQVKRLYNFWVGLWSTIVIIWFFYPIIQGIIRTRKENKLVEKYAEMNQTFIRTRRFYQLRTKVEVFLDKDESPTYEILFFMQFCTLIYQMMNLMFMDISYFAFMLTGTGLLKHINKIMSTLYKNTFEYDPDKVTLYKIISLHQKLLNLIQKYLNYMSPMIFFICCRSGEQFIVLAFTWAKIKTSDPKYTIIIIVLSFYLLQLFFYAWYSDTLKVEALKTPDAIYLGAWEEEYKLEKRLAVRFIIERSQKTIIIKGFQYLILDLALMINIIQTSFSVYTLLTNLSEDDEHLHD